LKITNLIPFSNSLTVPIHYITTLTIELHHIIFIFFLIPQAAVSDRLTYYSFVVYCSRCYGAADGGGGAVQGVGPSRNPVKQAAAAAQTSRPDGAAKQLGLAKEGNSIAYTHHKH
jgi:hypothetical protein